MFCLDEEEQKTLEEWLKEHDKTCELSNVMNQGAIGGRLTFCFTPTGLGEITTIKCGCGEEVCVTNFDHW